MWVTDNAACMQMLNKLWSTSYNLNQAPIPPDPLLESSTTTTTPSTSTTTTQHQQQQNNKGDIEKEEKVKSENSINN